MSTLSINRAIKIKITYPNRGCEGTQEAEKHVVGWRKHWNKRASGCLKGELNSESESLTSHGRCLEQEEERGWVQGGNNGGRGGQSKVKCADPVACSKANKILPLALNLAGKRSATSRCHCWSTGLIWKITSTNK
jgi:hypothetical protein